MTFESHDDYLARVPLEARSRLQRIQAEVELRIPEAVRCISYKMPAFRDRRVFLYFAAFSKHIGIYPPVTRDAALIAELAPYRGPKGNLSFPLTHPLPIELIGRVAVALHEEYGRGEGVLIADS